MSDIAILGTGRVGAALGAKLASAAHSITFGTRTPDQAREAWSGPPVAFAEASSAIRAAEIVVNTTPGATSLPRLTALREDLAGRILVDIANATERAADGAMTLLFPNGSLAEALQQALPDTRVTKTLNTMVFMLMTDPAKAGTEQPPTAFLSGDDDAAKAAVRTLLHDLGWPDEWIEDLGGIASARDPEAFMLFVPHLARRHGFVPFGLSLALPPANV